MQKKNIPASLSSDGSTLASTENPSESVTPSIGKIKQDNIAKVDLGNSRIIKDRMASDFANNPNPIFREKYIDTLSKKGYDKDQLKQYADSLDKTPENYTSPTESMDMNNTIGSIASNYAENVKNTFMAGNKQVNEAINEVPLRIKEINTSKPITDIDFAHPVLKAALGTMTAVASPVIAAFNMATEGIQKVATKTLPEPQAKVVGEALPTVFSLAHKAAASLGYTPEQDTNGDMLLSFVDFIIGGKAMEIGGKAIKSAKEFKDVAEKSSEGKLNPEEQKQFEKGVDEIKNTSLDDLKKGAEQHDTPQAKEVVEKINEVKPVSHDKLHDELASLQAQHKILIDEGKEDTPDEQRINQLVNFKEQEIKEAAKNNIHSIADEAMVNGKNESAIADLDKQIEETTANKNKIPSDNPLAIQREEEYINNLKTQKDAIQKSSTSSILQHPQEGVGEQGSGRSGVEPSQQGNKTSQTSENQSEGYPKESVQKENVTIPSSPSFNESVPFDGKDYAKGKTAETIAKEKNLEITSPEEGQRFIAENSENPLELAHEYLNIETEAAKDKKSYKDQLLDDANIKLTTQEFKDISDKSNLSHSIAKEFLDENRTTHFDKKLEEIKAETGVEITHDELADYINRKGSGKYIPKDTPIKTKFKNRFADLTGKDLTPARAKSIIESENKKYVKDYDKYLKSENITQADAEQQYYEGIRNGTIPYSDTEGVGNVQRDQTGETGKPSDIRADFRRQIEALESQAESGRKAEELRRTLKSLNDMYRQAGEKKSLAEPPISEPPKGSIPSEESDSKLTKITHAAIEKDRAEMGLPPIEKEPSDIKQDFIDAHKEFQSADKLAQTLIDSKRPATRKEVYILGLRQVKLKSEAKAIREKIVESKDKNADELRTQLRLAEEELDNNERAIKNVSSEGGKSLQAFQAAFAEDMSLEGTLLAARSYSKEGKLTPTQEKIFTEISQRLEKVEKRLAEYENNKSKKDSQKVIDNLISEPKVKNNILNRTKEERLSKIEELKQKWNNLNNDKNRPVQQGLGISEEHLKIIVELGAEYIGLGVTEFKAWSKKIQSDLGKVDDDELKKIWDSESTEGIKLKDFAEETEKNKTVKVSESEGKIKNLHAKLKNLVAKGFTDVNDIVKEINKELPDMTEREIRDEISGYGKTSEYSQEPLNKKIREIKRIGGLISALEDAQKGESPKRKGLQRDEPTAKEAELRKQVHEAMRENQLQLEKEPKTDEQWKTALDRYKKRLKNKHDELIDKKNKNDYEIKKRQSLELDSEALSLKRAVDSEKGLRKRELEKIRLSNRGKLEKFADTVIKAMRFMALAGLQKPILKLGIAGAMKGYLQNPVNTLIAGIFSKVPGIRNIYDQSPRWRNKGSAAALGKGIAEAWSKKTLKDIVEQAKGGKRSDEIQFETDKGHLPPSLWEAWNVEHKILKTPLMNAEFKNSMEKNLAFLNDKGMNIADPITINLAAARATQDALRAVYLNKSPLVSGYQAAIKIMGADTKDGSFGGKVVSKVIEGDNLIVKVPTNFIVEQMESTPLGFIQAVATKDFINTIRGKVNDLPPDVADRLARKLNNATAGTIALTIGGLLYLHHFGGNKYIRQQNHATGQKDKLKEGDMNLLGVEIPHYCQHFSFAQSLQMGAGIARVMDYYNNIDRKTNHHKENHLVKGVWESAGSTVSKIPFVSSAVEGGEAMTNSANVEKLMGRYIDNVMLLPGEAASLMDSKETENRKRNAITPMEHIRKNIPGLRETLPLKFKKR